MLQDTKGIQHTSCLMLHDVYIPGISSTPAALHRCRTGYHIGKHRLLLREFMQLGQICKLRTILAHHLPLIRLLRSRNDPKKRCLACSINSDNTDLLPFLNSTGNVVEDPFVTI